MAHQIAERACRECGAPYRFQIEDHGILTSETLEVQRRCPECRAGSPSRKLERPKPVQNPVASESGQGEATPLQMLDGRFVLVLGVVGVLLSLSGITTHNAGDAFGGQANLNETVWYSMFVLTFWLSVAVLAGGLVLTIFARRP